MDPESREAGYYLEIPAVAHTSPNAQRADKKETTLLEVGHQRWRFSSEGIVQVWHEVKRKRDPVLHKMIPTPFHWATDPCDGRTVVLSQELSERLVPGGPDMPAFGHLFKEHLPPQEDRHVCCRCAKVLIYAAGTGPSLCVTEQPDILLASEYAVLTVEGTGKRYVLCSACIPEGFIYCGWCRAVHRRWSSSPALSVYSHLVMESLCGRLPGDMIIREYTGSGKTPPQVILSEHFDDRVAKVIELVGRGTVCPSPNPNIAANTGTLVSELYQLNEYWKAALRNE